MNVRQSVLKISVLSLALLGNAVSFGMIVRYKDEATKKAVQASVTSLLERKKFEMLSLKEQGMYNLEKLFRNKNNPQFVQKFLRDKDIPVLILDHSMHFRKQESLLGASVIVVTPYLESFYSNPDKKVLNEEILKRGEQKLQQAIAQKTTSHFPIKSINEVHCPLVMASLFGNNEDIQKELRDDTDLNLVHCAIVASMNCPNKKNNAFELLLPNLKKNKHVRGQYDEVKMMLAYQLLCSAADCKNKEAFELLANKDPYNANMLSGGLIIDGVMQKGTVLDLAIDNKDVIGQENINILRDNGGMTSKEVDLYNELGGILQHLGNRHNAIRARSI